MEIFKLFGSIFVNTDEAEKSMAKTEKGAESVAAKLGNGVQKAAKWGAAIVSGATVAASAVFGLATDAAGTADEIDKMSQKIGISAEAYQEWSYVMGQNGMDVEKLSVGMKTLVSQMDSAAAGTASAQENFDRLGVSIYDADGKLKGQEEILDEVMHSLADMENGTEKARLATELFGKAGVEMMPMLNQGSGAMDELTDRAHELGLVMSDEAVSAGVKLGDTIDDIKKSFSMIGTSLGAAVIPVIQQFADLVVDSMPMIQESLGALAPVLVDMASTFLPVMAELAGALLPVIVELISSLLPVIAEMASAILPVLVSLMEAMLPPLMEILQTALPPLVSVIEALMPLLATVIQLLAPILELFVGLLEPIASLVVSAIMPLVEIIISLIDMALKPLIPVVEAVAKLLEGTLGAAFEGLSDVIDGIMQALGGLIDFVAGVFTGDWERAWNGVVDIFAGIFTGIVAWFKTPINAIISGINSVFESIGKIKVPDWVPIIGGASFSLPQIPLLAKGGTVVEGGRAIVGEKGPELLDLPAGAKVTPLDRSDAGGTEIDYDMLLKAIVEAIRIAAPELERVFQIVPDESGIFRIVRKKAVEYRDTTGKEAFV